MESIEATGTTVQEAIETGMAELGVTNPSQVMVEVVQEPDQGIMGHGVREAVVRLIFMGTRNTDDSSVSIVSKPVQPDEDVTIISSPPPVEEADETPISDYAPKRADEPDAQLVPAEHADEDAQVGKEVLEELLDKMGLEGRVAIYRAPSTRQDESTHWILNIQGRSANNLIGRRGETLSSMQYIVRLIVSRRLQRRANIIVDAGGYKSKRSDRLRDLAVRMAEQAISQKRTVTLEPMPPNERRIIHLTLRKREDVTTKSVGEGQKRRVTITPAQ